MRLVDTAGIRDALDEAESIGVRKSMEALADADMVLVVLDAAQPKPAIDEADADAEGARLIVAGNKVRHRAVQNKIDLATARAPAARRRPGRVVMTSALTGQGIDRAAGRNSSLAGGDGGAQQESGFLTNVRQHKLVQDSIAALDAAVAAVPLKTPHEMLLLDLYNALRPLDEITGATTADDILNLIFSSFCIGK